MEHNIPIFIAVGFLAPVIDGALGMAHGVSSTSSFFQHRHIAGRRQRQRARRRGLHHRHTWPVSSETG